MPGVYISYPFCAQKCSFCNFASGVSPAALEREYIDALVRSIKVQQWPWTPETVYIGGGTPSRMERPDLLAILNAVPGRPWREAAIEAAPGSLTAARVEAWVEAGINRVSLGVQSFVRPELARTGRRHTAEVVAEDVALLAQHGLTNINIDLIAGLPGQTEGSWRQSLDWIHRLDPPHVSVYLLEVDEDSRLGLEILQGGGRYGAGAVPSGDMMAELYGIALTELRRVGIERYEISNFARPGFESVHNLKYWKLEPYLGFGADAHSFDGSLRWGNVETASEFVARATTGLHVQTESTPANADEERFFVGLRLSRGIDLVREDEDRHGRAIGRLVTDGLLERSGHTIRLTNRGVLLSNEVFEEFIA